MLRPWALPTCARRRLGIYTLKQQRWKWGAETEAEEGRRVWRPWQQRQRQLLLQGAEEEGGK